VAGLKGLAASNDGDDEYGGGGLSGREGGGCGCPEEEASSQRVCVNFGSPLHKQKGNSGRKFKHEKIKTNLWKNCSKFLAIIFCCKNSLGSVHPSPKSEKS
jgi:hypothetical protein